MNKTKQVTISIFMWIRRARSSPSRANPSVSGDIQQCRLSAGEADAHYTQIARYAYAQEAYAYAQEFYAEEIDSQDGSQES
jgi:hypothetical protein